VMIHRTVLGSIERFLGILIEHYGGALPAWLAPVQMQIVPVADRHTPYAEQVRASLQCAGLRAETDLRSESVSKKIRDGEVLKVPFMLVVGDREVEQTAVNLRTHGSKETQSLPLEETVALLVDVCRPPAVSTR
jgi:threonyl-tRNA synthetase